jgi:general stress protein YciG
MNNEENKTVTEAPAANKPKPRGFAAMDRAKVSAIASKGGKAAHAAGTAHKFTSEEASAAGKKGGIAPHVSRGRSLPKPSDSKDVGDKSEIAIGEGRSSFPA